MSDPEKSLQDFLQRWSRRKLGVDEPLRETPQAPADSHEPGEPNPDNDPSAVSSAGDVEPFDLTSLPPVESINSTTDIRAFLAPGVPLELTRAAFRRAWLSDPAIRDFVGLAENQWDFTNPDAVPGFGSIELTPEIRSMVAALFREPSTKHAEAPAAGSAMNTKATASPETTAADRIATTLPDSAGVNDASTASPDSCTPDAAVHHDPVANSQAAPHKPRHGGALPK